MTSIQARSQLSASVWSCLTLTNPVYDGSIEYFENMVARIDTPLIGLIELRFLNGHVIVFPQLDHFI